jgi:hypothetical protein
MLTSTWDGWRSLVAARVSLRSRHSSHITYDFAELLNFSFFLLTSAIYRELHFRSHRRKFAHAFIETALEIL